MTWWRSTASAVRRVFAVLKLISSLVDIGIGLDPTLVGQGYGVLIGQFVLTRLAGQQSRLDRP